MIASHAVLMAIGVDWDGRRQALGVELANRGRSSWRDFLLGLRERALAGVEFVVADDHAGLKAAIREVLQGAAYQRCYVHFLRNSLDYVPRKSPPTGLTRGWTTTACKSCAGWSLPSGRLNSRTRGIGGISPRRLDRQVADQVSAAGWMGRGKHRRDAQLLPIAAPTPQASEEHQHVWSG